MRHTSLWRIGAGVLVLCLLCALVMVYAYNMSDAENRACEWERKYKVAVERIKQLERIVAEMMLEEIEK